MIKPDNLRKSIDYTHNQAIPFVPHAPKVGELLVEMGKVSPEIVEKALEKQEKIGKKKKIGEILVEEGHVDKRTLAHALIIQSFITLGALFASLVIDNMSDATPYASAASFSKPMEITVRVKPSWSISVNYQKQNISITEDDIRRGYVDVPQATHITIKDSSKSGFMLLFEGLDRPFRYASIQGLPGAPEVVITSKSTLIHQQSRRTQTQLILSYRFYLAEDAKPGEYRWPVTITLQPA
jgi:bifunctional DNase/RNase